jgi:predicted DNA-binding antitoxin AbrB/MazE fold protein
MKKIKLPEGKKYYITRSTLNFLKKKYNMENESDKEFLEWWRRNIGTGYEAFDLIYIDESE